MFKGFSGFCLTLRVRFLPDEAINATKREPLVSFG